MTIPIADENKYKIAYGLTISLLEPYVKSKMPSTKRKCVIKKLPPIMIPLKDPFDLACCINLLNPSTIMRNKRGARGQPCLKSLPGLKKDEVDPLTSTTKDVIWTHDKIHLTNSS